MATMPPTPVRLPGAFLAELGTSAFRIASLSYSNLRRLGCGERSPDGFGVGKDYAMSIGLRKEMGGRTASAQL